MDWERLISAKRLGMEGIETLHKDDRSAFLRDYDRLIFSAPFRRLQNKTQVFPLPGSVFVHNRLTHSLEVACVGRSLGNNVSRELIRVHPELTGTNITEIGNIVSAACLAHDMGNPPFGHSGEKAISAYFTEGKGQSLEAQFAENPGEWTDIINFEGNANAFRLLAHQFIGRRKGGFAMTYSTLASIVKYPYASILANGKHKFGFFCSEAPIFAQIADELGIIRISDSGAPLRYVRYPLVWLVEAADDICYLLMDLEDAHKLKLLSTNQTIGLMMDFLEPSEQEHAKKIIDMVKEFGMEKRVCYSSFNHYTVKKVKELDPSAEVGFLYADGPIDMPAYGVKHGVNALHPALYNLQYPGFVEECKKNGLKLHVWTVNDETYMESCAKMGVEAVITNYPDLARTVIGR